MKPVDCVVVKQGVRDPDFNSPIEAWQGRVIDLCENEDGSTLLTIEWDSQTLSNIPEEVLLLSVRSGLDWALMYLLEDEVQITKPRDTPKEVKQARERIYQKEMKIIEEDRQKQLNIIAQVTQNREAEDLEMVERQLHDWRIYLEKNLSFPFEAEIIEPSILG